MCRALLCLSLLNRLGGKVGEEGGEGAEEDAGEDIGRVVDKKKNAGERDEHCRNVREPADFFVAERQKISAAAKLDDVWPEGNE